MTYQGSTIISHDHQEQDDQHIITGYGAMDRHIPHEFIGFGDMDSNFPFSFVGFGAMDGNIPFYFAYESVQKPPLSWLCLRFPWTHFAILAPMVHMFAMSVRF